MKRIRGGSPSANPNRMSPPCLLVALDVVLGTAEVPVGRYAREVLAKAEASSSIQGLSRQVEARVVSQEHNTRMARAKVELGEADVALVYCTDANTPALEAIPLPSHLEVLAPVVAIA